jgi:hypothetical protein
VNKWTQCWSTTDNLIGAQSEPDFRGIQLWWSGRQTGIPINRSL